MRSGTAVQTKLRFKQAERQGESNTAFIFKLASLVVHLADV